MGNNNLSSIVDGNSSSSNDVNQYKTALSEAILPRDSNGDINDSGSDLGGSSNQFKDVYYDGIAYNGGVPLLPPGMLTPYAGATEPAGWLFCDGDTIGNTASGATHAGAQYAALFAVVVGAWGNVGTEDFADDDTVILPDTRGRFLRDLDKGKALDSGRVLGTDQADLYASHTHPQNMGFSPNTGGSAAHGAITTVSGSGYNAPTNVTSTAGDFATRISTDASGSGSDTRPLNVAVNYIIKI